MRKTLHDTFRNTLRRLAASTLLAIAAAGRIMIPTAISVPSAWKPATRLSTSSTMKP